MAKRRGRNRFASQAALEALVRFGPELSGLKALQRQAVSNFGLGVNQAHGTANAIVGAIDTARPDVEKVYDSAGLKQAGIAGTLMGHDIAGLGHVADSIKAGASLEAAGAADRLNTEKTRTLTGLDTQKVRARQGEQFAIGNAKDQFIKSVTEILERKQDLSREKGAFTAATIGDLVEAAADRKLKQTEGAANRENARTVAGVDAEGHVIEGGPKDPALKGTPKKVNTDLQHGSLDDAVGNVKALIPGIKAHRDRKAILDLLVNGRPATKVTVDGKEVSLQAIKAHSPLVAQAALELYFDKKISRKTLKKLHDRGYSIKKLGWKYASGKKKTPQQKLTGTVIDNTKAIAELLGGLAPVK